MLTQFPGFIDVHVHLRDPGQTQKEDFFTGTAAALAGGFTTVLDMPNNAVPVTTAERLAEKIASAKAKTVCDIGFYFGSLGDNIDQFPLIHDKVFGIKLYLNHTTGNFLINGDILDKVFRAWVYPQPILTHSEEDTIGDVVKAVRAYGKRTHVCHVSSKKELEPIIQAKEEGLPITCGVCPHHLFLTEDDVAHLGSYGRMKPSLKSKADQDFLWEHLRYVDTIESDHAPHTKEEKDSDTPPFGVPGLETTLPLLFMAEKEGRIGREDILTKLYDNPKRIFSLPTDPDTKVEIDLDEEFEITNEGLHTKCGWTPFAGMKGKGRVKRVILRGKTVFENGNVLMEAGSGRIVRCRS
ncbi:amidohydrolase family protein [Candidatus Roizmanbacteria bacterium]|nr:amidohydrolase family protein [Candidatus Roizmanbacteria bacterium]